MQDRGAAWGYIIMFLLQEPGGYIYKNYNITFS